METPILDKEIRMLDQKDDHHFLSYDEQNKLKEFRAIKKALSIGGVGQSLVLVEVDKDVLKICVDAYKDGEKIQAVKTLIEEVKKVHHFSIKEAKEYLESQC